MNETELDVEFRSIIAHAFLGEDQNIGRESFDLAINGCVEFHQKQVEDLKEDRLKLLGIRLLLEIKEEEIQALEKEVKELGKENKTIRDAFVEQIKFLLELDRPNIIDTSMTIYKLIKK